MAHDDLVFPRRVYKGKAVEKGTLPDPVESKTVEDRAAFDAALKAGWRAHRDDGKAANDADADDDDDKKADDKKAAKK